MQEYKSNFREDLRDSWIVAQEGHGFGLNFKKLWKKVKRNVRRHNCKANFEEALQDLWRLKRKQQTDRKTYVQRTFKQNEHYTENK